MLQFVILGLTFGASAGLSPGPLQTLVISATLRHNLKEGIKTAFAPLMTDGPVVLISILILSQLSEVNWILGTISFCGGLFLIYLGYESFKSGHVEIGNQVEKPKSIQKAIVTNFLSPNPYIFWFSVGAPTFVNAFKISGVTASLFLVAFYVTIISSFLLTAFLVSRFRHLLQGKLYTYTMRFLGLSLILFSVLFFRNGLKFWGIL